MSFTVIAHRGDSEHHAENTLPAFEAAIKAGADMIELDIALASDGAFVVIHDDTLSRTTSGDGFVGHLPSDRIHALDAGHWFKPDEGRWLAADGTPLAQRPHTGIHVPTLAHVLDALGGRIELNIEIKPFFPLAPRGHMQAALEHMVRELGDRRMTGQVLLSSTNFYMLEFCRKLDARIRIGLVYRRPLTDFDPVYVGKAFGAYSIHPWHRQATGRFLQVVHRAGFRVFPYTVNDAKRLLELRDMGADGVFTDDPAAARRALADDPPAQQAGAKREKRA